uniref:LIM domain-containing protein C4F6.12 n=1 Tax=Lygus hesperus TaxID=30085 RepID=A0A0A9YGL1_LYGHE
MDIASFVQSTPPHSVLCEPLITQLGMYVLNISSSILFSFFFFSFCFILFYTYPTPYLTCTSTPPSSCIRRSYCAPFVPMYGVHHPTTHARAHHPTELQPVLHTAYKLAHDEVVLFFYSSKLQPNALTTVKRHDIGTRFTPRHLHPALMITETFLYTYTSVESVDPCVRLAHSEVVGVQLTHSRNGLHHSNHVLNIHCRNQLHELNIKIPARSVAQWLLQCYQDTITNRVRKILPPVLGAVVSDSSPVLHTVPSNSLPNSSCKYSSVLCVLRKIHRKFYHHLLHGDSNPCHGGEDVWFYLRSVSYNSVTAPLLSSPANSSHISPSCTEILHLSLRNSVAAAATHLEFRRPLSLHLSLQFV